MKLTLPYQDFQNLFGTACKVMESSEIGVETIGSEHGPAFSLSATGSSLVLETTTRGMEIRCVVETDECAEEGDLTINPFLLRRMTVKAQAISLESSKNRLTLRAGRFKTDVSTFQDQKVAKYDVVPVTHEIPAKLLLDSLTATTIQGKDGRPFSRLLWDQKGLRVWAHNAYNAAHSVVLDEPHAEPLDCIVPVSLLRAVAISAPKQNIRLGANRSAIRIQNDLVDCSHPLNSAVTIEDIERVVGALDDSIPSFEVEPQKLQDALSAVGSVDRVQAGTPQSGVDLWVVQEKSRLVVAVRTPTGHSTYRVPIKSIRNMPDDTQLRLNHRQLTDFVARSKGQALRVGLLSDRTILWAGTTTYVLAPVQEGPEP